MGGGVAVASRRACIELRLDVLPRAPSFRGRLFKRSSGICCAVVSSTKIRRTFKASFPKLKNEKKYYRYTISVEFND